MNGTKVKIMTNTTDNKTAEILALSAIVTLIALNLAVGMGLIG